MNVRKKIFCKIPVNQTAISNNLPNPQNIHNITVFHQFPDNTVNQNPGKRQSLWGGALNWSTEWELRLVVYNAVVAKPQRPHKETGRHTNNQILVNPVPGGKSWCDNSEGGAVKVRERENVGLGFSEIPLWSGRRWQQSWVSNSQIITNHCKLLHLLQLK